MINDKNKLKKQYNQSQENQNLIPKKKVESFDFSLLKNSDNAFEIFRSSWEEIPMSPAVNQQTSQSGEIYPTESTFNLFTDIINIPDELIEDVRFQIEIKNTPDVVIENRLVGSFPTWEEDTLYKITSGGKTIYQAHSFPWGSNELLLSDEDVEAEYTGSWARGLYKFPGNDYYSSLKIYYVLFTQDVPPLTNVRHELVNITDINTSTIYGYAIDEFGGRRFVSVPWSGCDTIGLLRWNPGIVHGIQEVIVSPPFTNIDTDSFEIVPNVSRVFLDSQKVVPLLFSDNNYRLRLSTQLKYTRAFLTPGQVFNYSKNYPGTPHINEVTYEYSEENDTSYFGLIKVAQNKYKLCFTGNFLLKNKATASFDQFSTDWYENYQSIGGSSSDYEIAIITSEDEGKNYRTLYRNNISSVPIRCKAFYFPRRLQNNQKRGIK